MTTKSAKRFCGWMSIAFVVVVIILILGVHDRVFGATAAIVVEDNTSRITIGRDTTLGDAIEQRLGYTIAYLDIDILAATPATYNYAYWDTFKIVISVGPEVATPSPSAYMDTVNNAPVPWVAMSSEAWDEIQLGGSSSGTDGRVVTTAGHYANIGTTHWITKVLQDSAFSRNPGSSLGVYGLVFPDSFHSVVPLLIDRANKTDTAKVLLAVADSNVVVINTGTPIPATTRDRRAFLGMYSISNATTLDSCQWYTTFLRTVAWAAHDTLNDGVMKYVCFSGGYEIEDNGVMENSSGTDSIENYGAWPDLYTGWDYEEKTTVIKLTGEAIKRKFSIVYRDVTVDTANWRWQLKLKNWDITPPATYWESFSLRPMKQWWLAGRGVNCVNTSGTCPGVSWTYRYVDTSTTPDTYYAWDQGGGKSDGVDWYAVDADSVTITQATATGSYIDIKVDVDTFTNNILDTTTALGWGTHVMGYSNGGPGLEINFYAVDEGTVTRKPLFTTHLSAYSTTVPSPVIVVSPTSITKSGAVGGEVSGTFVNVTNSSDGAMLIDSVHADSVWVTGACLYTCEAPTQISVQFDYGARPAGTYIDTVKVYCADATNNPKAIPVTLTVTGAVTTFTATKRTVRK